MKKNQTVAAFLAFFLGGAGAHKFYLGRIGQGVIYAIFFWTWIPAILGIIEGIIIANMDEDKFYKKYCVKPRPKVYPDESASSYVDEVKRLYDLKEKGIITEEEFERKKKMIL